MRFGAHISVSGGYERALDYAFDVGCECAQIFAKSPRQWRASALGPQQGRGVRHRAARTRVRPALHPHRVPDQSGNPRAGAAREVDRGACRRASSAARCSARPAWSPTSAATRWATLRLRPVVSPMPSPARSNWRVLPQRRLGCCSRTRLARAGRSDRPSRSSARASTSPTCRPRCSASVWTRATPSPSGCRFTRRVDGSDVVAGITECCGTSRLGLIHANDCMFELGSKRDRHAWIGDGHIGEAGFEAMVCLPELRGRLCMHRDAGRGSSEGCGERSAPQGDA